MTENYERLKNEYDKPITNYRELLKNDYIITNLHSNIIDFNGVLKTALQQMDLSADEIIRLQNKIDSTLYNIEKTIQETGYSLEKN